jgi:hypothetical protein
MTTHTKTLNMQTDKFTEDIYALKPGDRIELYFYFPETLPTPAHSFGLGFDGVPNGSLTAGDIKKFTGTGVAIFPDDADIALFHPDGSLMWTTNTVYEIKDLRGATVKITLDLSTRAKPLSVQLKRAA